MRDVIIYDVTGLKPAVTSRRHSSDLHQGHGIWHVSTALSSLLSQMTENLSQSTRDEVSKFSFSHALTHTHSQSLI